jgi:hypothetical protein
MATCERRSLVEGKTARKLCQYNVTTHVQGVVAQGDDF